MLTALLGQFCVAVKTDRCLQWEVPPILAIKKQATNINESQWTETFSVLYCDVICSRIHSHIDS